MSPDVTGGRIADVREQVPEKSVRVVSSNSNRASQQWGTCGVSRCRTRLPPRSITSSCWSGLGGRFARSLSETMQPSSPCATVACGAASSHSFIEPHSSDSTWPKVIHLRESGGSSFATAPRTAGNIPRGPVWNSSGLVGADQELIERQPHRPDLRHERADSEDLVCDLVGRRVHDSPPATLRKSVSAMVNQNLRENLLKRCHRQVATQPALRLDKRGARFAARTGRSSMIGPCLRVCRIPL